MKTQKVIEKFILKHGHLYDYSKVIYKTAKTKVEIVCKEHGSFFVTPNNHLSGNGCSKCKGKGFSLKEQLLNFKLSAKKIHGEKYDYSKLTEDEILVDKYHIICPRHGSFLQCKRAHITNKSGCPTCGKESTRTKTKQTLNSFIDACMKLHPTLDYSKTVILNAHTKVEIVCKEHGSFFVTPANHRYKLVGCPSCSKKNASRGEQRISKWLFENNITHECQKTFHDLKGTTNNSRLRYDFFVSPNILIEYDGEQHFKPITFNKQSCPKQSYDKIIKYDKRKSEYALSIGYKLIRIKYDEPIEEILEDFFRR